MMLYRLTKLDCLIMDFLHFFSKIRQNQQQHLLVSNLNCIIINTQKCENDDQTSIK